MDPLTHMVTGTLVAQAAAPDEHRFAYALVAAGAAVVPDIDFLARKAPGKLLFLKLHRGVTHSLLATPLIAACASGCSLWLFGTPFWHLFGVCVVAAVTHMVLDTIMHSTGLQWLWPLRRRLGVPLVIGLNPLTSSARCGERSLLVCLRCTMHSALLSPLVQLLWAGFVASLVAPPWRLVSQVTLGAWGAYMVLCALLGRVARGRLAAAGPPATRRGVYPGAFNPARWIGVSELEDGRGYQIHAIGALSGQVARIGEHGPSAQGPAVEASRATDTVQEFLENAVFPHAEVLEASATGGTRVVWRDLAFAFSPSVALFTARVDLTPRREIAAEEFRERWDRNPAA